VLGLMSRPPFLSVGGYSWWCWHCVLSPLVVFVILVSSLFCLRLVGQMMARPGVLSEGRRVVTVLCRPSLLHGRCSLMLWQMIARLTADGVPNRAQTWIFFHGQCILLPR